MNLDFIDRFYVQPASNDEGVAIGATYVVGRKHGLQIQPMNTIYLGPEFTNDNIKKGSRYNRIPFFIALERSKITLL